MARVVFGSRTRAIRSRVFFLAQAFLFMIVNQLKRAITYSAFKKLRQRKNVNEETTSASVVTMLKGCDFPRDNKLPSGYSRICRYGAAPDAAVSS
jgi:hypothetical protein